MNFGEQERPGPNPGDEMPNDAGAGAPQGACGAGRPTTGASDGQAMQQDGGPGEPHEASGAETLEARIAELSEALRRAEEERDQNLAGWKRAAADFENFKRRAAREREEMAAAITGSTVQKFLPLIDNLERALDAARAKGETGALYSGVEMVARQALDILKQEGIEPIQAQGKEFDPRLMDALVVEETPEYPDGAVIAELMRGYVFGSRVLRPAMVKVARAPQGGSSEAPEGPDAVATPGQDKELDGTV